MHSPPHPFPQDNDGSTQTLLLQLMQHSTHRGARAQGHKVTGLCALPTELGGLLPAPGTGSAMWSSKVIFALHLCSPIFFLHVPFSSLSILLAPMSVASPVFLHLFFHRAARTFPHILFDKTMKALPRLCCFSGCSTTSTVGLEPTTSPTTTRLRALRSTD